MYRDVNHRALFAAREEFPWHASPLRSSDLVGTTDPPRDSSSEVCGDSLRRKRPSRVLVIDDNDNINEFVAGLLTIDGYQPVISTSVEDALEGFEGMNYALVITDIFMSGMGGIAGIAEMRKRQPNIKIIAMSGGFDDMTTESALQAAAKIGADAIMAKPLSPEIVNQLVGDFLG